MKKITVLIMLITTLGFTGCSSIMAISGSETPNIHGITRGMKRDQVEKILGKSDLKTLLNQNYVEYTYPYLEDNEPNADRAMNYLGMNMITGFLAEVILMPYEAFRPKEKEIVIVYRNDIVMKIVNN